ncbi:hypothetical protein BVX98_01170 [bacterium F11]|nr:hypothetical protein BVX98_01170 [bacterium F11]
MIKRSSFPNVSIGNPGLFDGRLTAWIPAFQAVSQFEEKDVIPAKAGIQVFGLRGNLLSERKFPPNPETWIPPFGGMTALKPNCDTVYFAGMTNYDTTSFGGVTTSESYSIR